MGKEEFTQCGHCGCTEMEICTTSLVHGVQIIHYCLKCRYPTSTYIGLSENKSHEYTFEIWDTSRDEPKFKTSGAVLAINCEEAMSKIKEQVRGMSHWGIRNLRKL